MRIQITLTVDVNERGWDSDYDTGPNPAAIRADVAERVRWTVGNEISEALTVVEP